MPRKIVETTQAILQFDDIQDFDFQVTTVPANLSLTAEERLEFDDRALDVPTEYGSIWVRVYQRGKNTAFVAHAEFGVGTTSVICDCVEVEKEYRRNNIATKIYDVVEAIADAAVQRSATQTSDAENFWRYREQR